MIKKIKEKKFTLSCSLPFLDSDLYSYDFKKAIMRKYRRAAEEYAKKCFGYNEVYYVSRYDSPYGNGTDFNYVALRGVSDGI